MTDDALKPRPWSRPSNMPRITCSCQFEVTGDDETENRIAYNSHVCPNKPPSTWHQSMFSPWGAVIFGALAIAAIGIVEALLGITK